MAEASGTSEGPKYGLGEVFADGKVRVFSTAQRYRSTRTEVDTPYGLLVINRNMRPYSLDHGTIQIRTDSTTRELKIKKPSKVKQNYEFYEGEDKIGEGYGRFDLFLADYFVEGQDVNLVKGIRGGTADSSVTALMLRLFKTPRPDVS